MFHATVSVVNVTDVTLRKTDALLVKVLQKYESVMVKAEYVISSEVLVDVCRTLEKHEM